MKMEKETYKKPLLDVVEMETEGNMMNVMVCSFPKEGNPIFHQDFGSSVHINEQKGGDLNVDENGERFGYEWDKFKF